MTDKMSDSERPRSFADALEVMYVGGVPAAAVLAFAIQPLLRLADLHLLFYAGLWLAGAVGMLAAARLFPPERPRRWVFWLYMLIPLVALIFIPARALDIAEWNNERCARIQGAMLHPNATTRDDLPDLFQALGCQPQGRAPAGVQKNSAEWRKVLAAEVTLEKTPAVADVSR